MNIVIGNIIALVASLLMVYSGLIKKKEKIIYIQTVQISMSVLSNIILGGITGAIINAIGCIRNILCYRNKLKTKEKIILIIVSTVLSLCFNNLGVIGLLPLIASIVYIAFMDVKGVIKFKILVIFTMIMWCIHDAYIHLYSSAIFNFLNILTNSIAICQLYNSKKTYK